MSTVTVVCPCGASFVREVKRGRPAIWCETCREIPMAKRVNKPEAAAVIVNEDGEVEELPENEHDKYPAVVRASIEASVKAVYAQWPEVWANRTSDEEANAWLSAATKAAYPTGH